MKKFIFLLALVSLISAKGLYAKSPSTTITTTYPKTVGYFSFILPIVTINMNQTTNDFSSFRNEFAIGFPVGVNILYSSRFGFSYEITPTIQMGNRSSKKSKILFDPGPMFRQVCFTPVFNKIVARTKAVNYFVAASLPCRLGMAKSFDRRQFAIWNYI